MADPGQGGKYYVVGQAGPEYLFQIARETLGDGRRYPEIVTLSRNRQQPDGAQLTDPMVLRPGWILELPSDADGPRVLNAPPASPPKAAPSTVPAVSDQAAAEAGRGRDLSFATPAAAVIAILAVLVLMAVRVINKRRAVAPDPAPAAARKSATRHGAADGTGADGGTPDGPRGRPGTSDEPAPDAAETPLPPDPVDGQLSVTVQTDAGVLDVRLIIDPLPGSAPAHVWLPRDARPEGMGLPANIGRFGDRHLWVDLSRAPDVVTVTGDPDAARAQARDLVLRWDSAGLAVTVVGDVLGEGIPEGVRRIAAFPGDGSALRGVMVSGGLRGSELSAARTLLASSNRGAVPVLVGRMLRARWSIVARPADKTAPTGAQDRVEGREQTPVRG